jgi:hypothetical protein
VAESGRELGRCCAGRIFALGAEGAVVENSRKLAHGEPAGAQVELPGRDGPPKYGRDDLLRPAVGVVGGVTTQRAVAVVEFGGVR